MWFTIYWLAGTISHIFGATIEDAFTHAGYGGGASKAVDWYNQGINETHYYDKEKKTWVEKVPIKTHIDDIGSLDPNEVMKLLEKFSAVIIEYPSKDQLIIQMGWGHFFLDSIKKSAWVNHISISFGEYCQGPYVESEDDDEDTHHFMMANSQYFAPADIAKASEVFLRRAVNEPFKSQPGSESMEDIHAKQKISYVE